MTTPHSYGFNSLGLTTNSLYQSMIRNRQLNRSQSLSSSYLHTQFSLPYCFSYSNWFLQSPQINFNPQVNKRTLEGLQSHPIIKPGQLRYTSVYKIDQVRKQRKKTVVIQISDDEAIVEVKTPSVVVDTPVCEKVQPLSVIIPPKLMKSLTDNQEGEIKIKLNEKIELKQKQLSKISRSYKINKKEKMLKNEILQSKSQLVQKKVIKRVILSQRINRKLKAMQDHYHIPKREKEMLKITRLREYGNEIMTGPKFQAELPDFILRKFDVQLYKKKIRQDLLGRLQNEEEQ